MQECEIIINTLIKHSKAIKKIFNQGCHGAKVISNEYVSFMKCNKEYSKAIINSSASEAWRAHKIKEGCSSTNLQIISLSFDLF